MRRRWAGVVAVIVVLGGAVWWLVRSAPPRVEVGTMAPDFTATNLRTGKSVSLRRDYRGTVTLVNIWATWCDPCKQEIPALDSLSRALAPRGFRIAAVSIDKGSPDAVRKFAADYHISFDVLHDPGGEIQEIYQTTGVPESFLVDRTGHLVRIAQMAAPWNSPENHRIVEHLLDAPAN